MKTILLIAHLIAIATGTGMSIANYINIRVASGEKGERRAHPQIRLLAGAMGSGNDVRRCNGDSTSDGMLPNPSDHEVARRGFRRCW